MAPPAPTRVPSQRPFLVFYGMAVVFVMFMHGWNDLNVALHEATTIATVSGSGSHSSIYYRYQVNGQTYSGQGHPGGTGPWPLGTTFQIRYSTANPSYSTLGWPLGFLPQIAIIWALIGLAHYGAPQRQKAAAAAASQSST